MTSRLRNNFSAPFAKLIIVSTLLFVMAGNVAPARQKNSGATAGRAAGILLLAHGGNQKWNDEVKKLAAEIDRDTPVEIAFGMASKRTIQPAIDRLVARGVREIVAVPLFISSHSPIITSTQYLLGLRDSAPPQLAAFARMDHSQGAHHEGAASAESFDPTTPVKSSVPIRMTSALDRHPIVAEILLSRAQSISRNPEREAVIVVAHGPVSDEDNERWLADMGALAEPMRRAGKFKRVEYMTVRDDAPESIRSKATAELRGRVEAATKDGYQVLIVPLLLSY
ncbi:MAG TPA: CbiX/SirB N-terminal domain-containing protein, partial [Blastocatellia bacterium]|nr:CbiX/SirB N-terminal domain-containing protein [Blastocatellia bacterium]